MVEFTKVFGTGAHNLCSENASSYHTSLLKLLT